MLKVLVVDDDSPIRRWLEYCVGQLEGFVLAGAAASGAQGLELYRKELPDIVITDIEMPGMSGLEMAARIQAIRPAHIIILTSHDNFSYARQALHSGTAEYILKTEVSLETMRDLLRRAAQTIQRAGGDAARQEQEAQAQALVRHLAMAEAQGPLTVQALRRQGITLEDASLAAGDLWSRDGAGLAGARRLIGESQTMKNLRFVPVGYEHLLWIGNLGYEGALEDLARSFEKQGGELGCVLGLSTACPGLQGLPGALREAQARCRLHFYQPQRWAFLHDGYGPQLLRRTESARLQFSRELFAQHYREAMAVKDEVLQRIADERPTDLDAVKKLCASFCTILLCFADGAAEDLDRRTEEIERSIQRADSLPGLYRAVEERFAPFEKTVMKQAYSPPVQDAVEYIRRHYCEKISLGTVAAAVNFSPEYFSRMFTRETGMNFTAFLNNLRLRKAMELLEHTDKKVYEIAEEVGYSSLSYFSTTFKKSFGQTPAEYQALKRGAK